MSKAKMGGIYIVYFFPLTYQNSCAVIAKNFYNWLFLYQINYQPPECATQDPFSLENFMLQLKERWVECTTYTRCSKKFQVHQNAIPPIMSPSMRSPVVLNTEDKKKSTVLDSMKHKYQGL